MNDHCGMFDESVEPDKKVVTYSVTSCPPDISAELNIAIGMKNNNGILGDLTIMKFSKESNISRNHSSETAIMKERNNIGDEGNLRGDSCSYNAGLEIHMDTGYVSTDEFVEDGSKAMDNTVGVEYVSDEEEDEFSKKLRNFLS
ncbi:hypothetical protein KP509_10G081500 [Ceratopteris richardii]|uniref:Uncharacterized protein n=1 Tax=Ceratopteris richardii TaxID=49495 RepID=A0A8T2U131_CERRI|nr:hypothetical protein KP509_10G081500 [Ceratopteris richardii]